MAKTTKKPKPTSLPPIEYRVAPPAQPTEFLRLVIQAEDTPENRVSMSNALSVIQLHTKFDKSRYNIVKLEQVHIGHILRNS